MKKFLITGILAFSAFFAQAQFEKGNFLLNGTIGYYNSSSSREARFGNTTTTTTGPTYSTFDLGLRGGYFLADNIAIGLILGHSNNSEDFNSGNDEVTTSDGLTSVGIFGRYYIPYGERFAFFGELGLNSGFGGSTTTIRDNNNTTTTTESSISLWNVGLAPGFTYMVHEKIGLDLSIGLLNFMQMTDREDLPNGNYTENTRSFSELTLSLTNVRLGISVFL